MNFHYQTASETEIYPSNGLKVGVSPSPPPTEESTENVSGVPCRAEETVLVFCVIPVHLTRT
jgi:hypothetical protein